MDDISIEKLKSLLTVKEVAEMFDVPDRVVRKAAKADPPTIPGVIKALGKYGFDPEEVASWTPPEPGTRAVGRSREDGRQRFRIYLTPDEAATLLAQGYEISDPREAAKVRRAAKKAATAEGEEVETESGEKDLFADFGA